jgi:Glycosyltransferase family 87
MQCDDKGVDLVPVGGTVARQVPGQKSRHEVGGDVLLYVASALLAAGLAAMTIYHGHRVWGAVSAAAYAAGALASLAQLRRGGVYHHRLAVAGAVFAASALVPLGVLVVQRRHGVPWSGQPEVDVVERMGRLLLDTGTPYAAVDTLASFHDYAPYLPVMAVFGLPRAMLGEAWYTDVRLVFLAVSALLVLLAVRLVHPPRVPVRAVQLVAVLPATTLTIATGGDDLPVLALLVLCVGCCHLGRVHAGGIAGGLALAMKLTAAPVLLVLAIMLRAQRGTGRTAVFVSTALAVAAVLVLPAAVMSPAALVEHVIRFPAGLTGVESPAASPLPGYLLAHSGTAGRATALALLAVAGIVVLGWVLRWPPRTAAQAAERAAIGLAVAMLLMPATRFGYLLYPLVLTGTAIGLEPTSSWYGWLRPGRAG